MKKINTFFDKASLLLVYPVLSAIIFVIAFCTFYFFAEHIGSTLGQNVIILLKISAVMSAMMGIPFTGLVYMGRKSAEFWQAAKVLEEKIDKAETQKELQSLYDNDLKELRRKASGAPHYSETKKLTAIILTKAKYVK